MRQLLLLFLTCLLFLSTYQVTVAFGERSADSLYTPKDVMLNKWISLCDRHPSFAYYEVIGQSVLGQDIYLFAIGNPQGGRVLYDGQLHGWEDGGTECFYVFAEWLLESQDLEAVIILKKNFNLFIPIVNVDTTNRLNMRREYVLPNGTVIPVPYGVDLNRNGVYGWGTSGSGDPTDNYDYRGLSPASEPETQAIRFALEKYRPQIYLNTHLGSSYVLHRSDTPFEARIKELIITYSDERGVTPYSMRHGLGGGLIATDADESFGASGWLIEIEYIQNLPDTLEDFLQEYYPRLFPIFLAFNKATEMSSTQHTLYVEVVGAGTTNATGDASYAIGSMVSVLATPDAGWTFDHWLLDNVDAGSDNPCMLMMDGNHNVTAVFTEVSIIPKQSFILLLTLAFIIVVMVMKSAGLLFRR